MDLKHLDRFRELKLVVSYWEQYYLVSFSEQKPLVRFRELKFLVSYWEQNYLVRFREQK